MKRLSDEEKKEMGKNLNEGVWDNISKIDGGKAKIRSINTRFIRVAAAAILIAIVSSIFFVYNRSSDKSNIAIQQDYEKTKVDVNAAIFPSSKRE